MLPISHKNCSVIADIHKVCFPRGWSEEEFSSLITPSSFGFLCDDESGFIFCGRVLDEAEIYTVCVLPEYRRLGKGGQLLDAALQYAKSNGVHKFFLEVDENNTAALALYTSRGFTQAGFRKNYYTDGNKTTNAVIMEKVF